jgi:hypothetical protein
MVCDEIEYAPEFVMRQNPFGVIAIPRISRLVPLAHTALTTPEIFKPVGVGAGKLW